MGIASAIDHTTMKVKVIHGASDGAFLLVGRTVGAVQAALSEPFGIPDDAIAFVNGERVELSHVLRSNDTLEFIRAFGEKGILDPDEKAQMDRMEAMMARLLESVAPSAKQSAAPKRLPGRRTETLEIAEYTNELRLQGKTWKEVLSACKKRWPDDRRVRNARQIRGTWSRYFGIGQNRH